MSDVVGANTYDKSLFTTVPAWLIVTHFLRQPETSGLGSIKNFHIFKYFLPSNHRLYEWRSLWDCVKSTPIFFWYPELLQNFQPQPDDFTTSISEYFSAFCKFEASTIVRDFAGWLMGKILAYPLKKIYARYASATPHSHLTYTTRSHSSLFSFSPCTHLYPLVLFTLNLTLSARIVSPLTLAAICLFCFSVRNIPQGGLTPSWRTMSIASRASCSSRPIAASTVAPCVVCLILHSQYTDMCVRVYSHCFSIYISDY